MFCSPGKATTGPSPASPYVVSVVKRWPEEYADPRTENALGKTPPGYTSLPRLDPREAIIIFGQMPPAARYFGEQSWVFTKQGRWSPEFYNEIASVQPDLVQYLFSPVPPGKGQTGRIVSFSSVNNNINNVTIERQSGSVWGQVRYFVVTPDQKMDRAVRSSLRRLGVAGNAKAIVGGEPSPRLAELERDGGGRADVRTREPTAIERGG
mgnify:CR=1 FL=1